MMSLFIYLLSYSFICTGLQLPKAPVRLNWLHVKNKKQYLNVMLSFTEEQMISNLDLLENPVACAGVLFFTRRM